jgi:hypothetical protein
MSPDDGFRRRVGRVRRRIVGLLVSNRRANGHDDVRNVGSIVLDRASAELDSRESWRIGPDDRDDPKSCRPGIVVRRRDA